MIATIDWQYQVYGGSTALALFKFNGVFLNKAAHAHFVNKSMTDGIMMC